MADDTSQDAELMAAAEKLMQDRLGLLAEHSANLKAVEDARAALAERQKDVLKSWTALASAWTESELRVLKLKDPSKRGPGRPRGGTNVGQQRATNRPRKSDSVPEQPSSGPDEQLETPSAGSTEA
ncbi:hypothetical protein [Streptomyces luteireticuli]|uniref:hypothetical protein n=1 Tax=Streptomyces luteireticuli TaxID=173858 RepID=UPI0031E35A2D